MSDEIPQNPFGFEVAPKADLQKPNTFDFARHLKANGAQLMETLKKKNAVEIADRYPHCDGRIPLVKMTNPKTGHTMELNAPYLHRHDGKDYLCGLEDFRAWEKGGYEMSPELKAMIESMDPSSKTLEAQIAALREAVMLLMAERKPKGKTQ